jgi:DNA-binding transcriptional regulator LsrR (DeoR family)
MKNPQRPFPPPASQDEDALRRLRLMVKIALMYHQRGMSQAQVAKHLGLSQARVSQLLKAAVEQQIVETVVRVPAGMFSQLEDDLERGYGLDSVAVVDAGPSGRDLKHALGAGSAPFVQMALEGAKVVGVAAWSETLLAAVEAMQPIAPDKGRYVVNVFGGFGPSASQGYTRVMQRLAQLCSARPVFLLGPGVVANARLRNALRREPQVQAVVSYYDRLSVLLVGIGALPTSPVLREIGYVSEEDQAELRAKGAIGDICLHFFDAEGRPVRSSLDDRVVGIELEQLRKVPRIVAVAGGEAKVGAIHAALRGRWVHSLITDLDTAQTLLKRL